MATRELTVTFTEQQIEILDRVKEDRSYGADYPQIALSVFRQYMREEFPDEAEED